MALNSYFSLYSNHKSDNHCRDILSDDNNRQRDNMEHDEPSLREHHGGNPMTIMSIPMGGKMLVCERFIGRGAFGSVYMGSWGITRAAIKLYSLISEKPFVRECDALIQCRDCPYIINVLGFGRLPQTGNGSSSGGQIVEQKYYMASEYTGARTLRTLLTKLEWSELQWIEKEKMMLELLEACKYMHQRGVCHHDLKPENVLLSDESARVCVADFGMATLETSPFRRQGKGTLQYAPPEALINEMDFASDIWSLGVMFFELCSHGELPFDGRTEQDLRNCIKRQNVAGIRQRFKVPPIWERIICDGMLHKDPSRRPSAEDIINELLSHGISLNAHSQHHANLLQTMRASEFGRHTEPANKGVPPSPTFAPSSSHVSHGNYDNHVTETDAENRNVHDLNLSDAAKHRKTERYTPSYGHRRHMDTSHRFSNVRIKKERKMVRNIRTSASLAEVTTGSFNLFEFMQQSASLSTTGRVDHSRLRRDFQQLVTQGGQVLSPLSSTSMSGGYFNFYNDSSLHEILHNSDDGDSIASSRSHSSTDSVVSSIPYGSSRTAPATIRQTSSYPADDSKSNNGDSGSRLESNDTKTRKASVRFADSVNQGHHLQFHARSKMAR